MRPTKYSKDIPDKTHGYIDGGYLDQNEPVPTIEGLACYLQVARSTLYLWAKDENKPEFSDMFERVGALQARLLFAGGLRGEFNAAITKLGLVKHGYSDKQEHELSGPSKGPIEQAVTFVPARLDEEN